MINVWIQALGCACTFQFGREGLSFGALYLFTEVGGVNGNAARNGG